MKKYFLHDESEQIGPFNLSELGNHEIKKETPVWYEGLKDWTPAGDLDELSELFKGGTPPPFKPKEQSNNKENTASEYEKGSSSNKLLTGVLIAIIVFSIGAFLVIQLSNDASDDGYYQQVMTIEEIERSKPTEFLSASGTYRENFWGDKLRLKCEFINKATIADYKDAKVQVTFYSKTKTVLGREEQTVYEIFKANSSKTVQLEVANYKDVESIGWKVISASPN
ncbi:MAG: DUF4339 domain-containing protein [Roseivirga sp.]|nr:DUF4339 domain-containing protein [Roseivirga sp.]